MIAYVDHLGRLEGKIARTLDNGFAMTIAATLRKRDKLAAQLTWLANRQILNLPEDRRHGRFMPRNPMARLILPNGTNVTCRIIDLSVSGAAIAIAPELLPPVGTVVTIGKTTGRVVRHIEDGFAIEFTRLQHPDFIEENVTGPEPARDRVQRRHFRHRAIASAAGKRGRKIARNGRDGSFAGGAARRYHEAKSPNGLQ